MQLTSLVFSQENAHHGVFPKSFVAHKMNFRLGALNVTVRDEDWNDMTVLRLELQSVESVFSQRPSADYLCLQMNMEKGPFTYDVRNIIYSLTPSRPTRSA